MKPAAFFLDEVVALIIRNQFDNGSLGQARWLIKDQSAVFHAGSNNHA